MITQGLMLMAVGMGVVFIFLSLMILIMNILAAVMKPLSKLIPEPEEKQVTKVQKAVVQNNDEDIAIAIAAVSSYVK